MYQPPDLRLLDVGPDYSQPCSWASFQGMSRAGERGAGGGAERGLEGLSELECK